MSTSNRDPRFVTERRGGTLTQPDHHALVIWAALCAEHVLPLFEIEHPVDHRPAEAINAARGWADGNVGMHDARIAAFAAHAAARETRDAAASSARAAGHAAATAHMADHAMVAAYYALLAVKRQGSAGALVAERKWQLQVLPISISDLVRSDMKQRATKFLNIFAMA